MNTYLATVRVLNWLVVVTISILAVLWCAGPLRMPPRFAEPKPEPIATTVQVTPGGIAPGTPAAPGTIVFSLAATPAPATSVAPTPVALDTPVAPAAPVVPAPAAPVAPAPAAPVVPAPATPVVPAPAAPAPTPVAPAATPGTTVPVPPGQGVTLTITQPPAATEAPAESAAAQESSASAPGQPAPPPRGKGITLKNAKRTALITGIIMLILNIGSVAVKLRGSTRARYLIFEKEGTGSLKIAVDAIEDTLMKCAAQVPEIQYADIRMILEKGGKMPRRAVAHCIFSDVPNLFVVQDNVRQILTSRYQEIFPNETLVFDIVVDRLKAEREPEQRRKKTEEDTKFRGEEYFGPKYPVER